MAEDVFMWLGRLVFNRASGLQGLKYATHPHRGLGTASVSHQNTLHCSDLVVLRHGFSFLKRKESGLFCLKIVRLISITLNHKQCIHTSVLFMVSSFQPVPHPETPPFLSENKNKETKVVVPMTSLPSFNLLCILWASLSLVPFLGSASLDLLIASVNITLILLHLDLCL